MSVSGANRSVARVRQEGWVAARVRGSDQHAQAIEAQAELVLAIDEREPQVFRHAMSWPGTA
ncbi:hypothetical protein MKK69_11235 [Methylobacterium sp. J-026]|uniref:hypothetical protein n=1 Tax=Methylobacterium sp. J-026 TaxID=2836624 RepID=UPI001FB8C5AA|nr:hypothetical protein [Methylobacterium sp. J-026]MCJ2134623.1 hypothetical protein [Methylobacterium sp. J-026]